MVGIHETQRPSFVQSHVSCTFSEYDPTSWIFFFFPEWLNFKCSVLSQSVGPVLGWVSPEANLDMRVHVCVAYLEGGLCQHLRGVWASEAGTERLETVRKERIPQNVL